MLACCEGPDAARCFDICGDGTRCEAGRCVVALAAPAPAVAPAPEAKSGKRGRRRAGVAAADGQAESGDAVVAYQPVADRHIPKYNASATTVLDPDAGSERLGDGVVRGELRQLEPAFNACIADAVAGGVDVGRGQVAFVFGLTAKGKVSGVTATAPAKLRDSGVLGCLRQVVFSHRFPTYDGPPMGVDYSFEVEL